MHMHNMHAYKETFVPVIYHRHQIISGIDIGIRYRLQNTKSIGIGSIGKLWYWFQPIIIIIIVIIIRNEKIPTDTKYWYLIYVTLIQ